MCISTFFSCYFKSCTIHKSISYLRMITLEVRINKIFCYFIQLYYEEMEKKYRLATEHDMPITCNVIKERGMIARIVVMG